MDGKLYISPILDCFNGEILSLCMANNMHKELCIDTHSRQLLGVSRSVARSCTPTVAARYTGDAFRQELRNCGLIQSLSGVVHCYDNARMESFFATLKKELIYRIPAYWMRRDEVRP